MNPALTHGAFSWSELMTSDAAKANAFYEKIFGWATQTMPMPQGNYFVQMNGELPVAGIMDLPQEGMPTAWMYYVTVDSVDETLEKVVSLGAQIVMPPMDIATVGRMAVIQDPQGAYLTVITYEPMPEGTDPNCVNFADAFTKAGSFSWFSLQTTDVKAACDFYSAAFGWTYQVMEMPMGPYHSIMVGEVGVGGIIPLAQEGIPPHWSSFVTVDDADAISAAAAAEGGAVIVPPMDIQPVGRFSMIQDPTGGMLNVIKYVPMEQPA
ncbi:MAG: putative enzyme related to lactoylglutathione lyase [Rhodothermales bacterium]|jgi:predicted enzyme related to lactoylglutathione lyase